MDFCMQEVYLQPAGKLMIHESGIRTRRFLEF